jgi:hypothetical protein
MWKHSELLLGAGRTMIPSQDLKERLVGVVSEQIPPDPGHDPNCPGGSAVNACPRYPGLRIWVAQEV